MSEILAVTASLSHIVAFIIYNKSIFKNESCPNATAWTLWTLMTAINATTYVLMSGDWIKSMLAIVAFLACITTFLLSFCKGKFATLNALDISALLVGLISIAAWQIFRSATYAHLVLQVGMIVPFISIYNDIWNKKRVENPTPWLIWGATYFMGALVVVLRWQGQYEDIIFPLRSFLLHFGVGIVALRNATSRKNT